MSSNNNQEATWQCPKCGTVIRHDKNRQPNTNGCPAGGFHKWAKLTH